MGVANTLVIYNMLSFNILQESFSLYPPLLGGVRTTSPIPTLEFMELGSFAFDNSPAVTSLNSKLF
jgi:hypothetical protein